MLHRLIVIKVYFAKPRLAFNQFNASLNYNESSDPKIPKHAAKLPKKKQNYFWNHKLMIFVLVNTSNLSTLPLLMYIKTKIPN